MSRAAKALLKASLDGYKKYLWLSGFCVLVSVLAFYATPFVTSFTLDFVIVGDSSKIPDFLLRLLEAIGGRDYLLRHIYLCGAAILLFTLINCGFAYLRRQYNAYASEGMATQMQNVLYRRLQTVPYDYHKHISVGDIVQRCSSDVNTVRRFVGMQAMEIVRTAAMFITSLVIMFSIHPTMTLICMCVFPVLPVSSYVFFRRVQKRFQVTDEAEGALSAAVQENLTGVRVVRAFGQQRAQMDKFTALNWDYRDKATRLVHLLAVYWGLSDMIGYCQIGVALVAGVIFYNRGGFSLGNVTLFVMYTAMLTWPVRQLGRILSDMGKAGVSLNRLGEIMQTDPEAEPGLGLMTDMRKEIAFSNVSFHYEDGIDVLRDVNFMAKPGQVVGILGATGSGKSSLVQLMQRLYTATGGAITIGGVNVNDINGAHLRRNIGIVLQEPFLYSRSVLENIRMGAPHATEEEVINAAKAAAVHEDIMGFAQGYQTLVGERGVTLSGGQQQRIAIARALLQNAPILIFDDSMSAVDTETDTKIREALRNLNRNGIVFLISHRITTLCRADLILVLEEGAALQQGNHAELLAQDGPYKRIAQIQNFGGED
ncbi:MAG: ABC transporter ATP-binding protein/permease [Clostridiales bacterium]|nr:ABC transporter ATP-binding protein/permease [Clostridiales bacterium]